jgi:uncharacterized protein
MSRPAFASIFVLASLLFSALPTDEAQAASFDCSKARKPVERMICADASLSSLDDRLAAAFTAASTGPSSSQVRADQRRWIELRDQCTSPICVTVLYRTRIEELGEAGATSAPSAGAQRPAPAPQPPAVPSLSAANIVPPPPSRTTQPDQVVSLPDRMIWEGRFKCGMHLLRFIRPSLSWARYYKAQSFQP